MKKLISTRLAAKLLIVVFILLAIFHVLILFEVLPADIVWGGHINDSSTNLIAYELIALFIILLFIMIVAAKINDIKQNKSRTLVNIGAWIIFVYFILNTLGNIASAVSVENLIFAPITILLTILSYRLAIEK